MSCLQDFADEVDVGQRRLGVLAVEIEIGDLRPAGEELFLREVHVDRRDLRQVHHAALAEELDQLHEIGRRRDRPSGSAGTWQLSVPLKRAARLGNCGLAASSADTEVDGAAAGTSGGQLACVACDHQRGGVGGFGAAIDLARLGRTQARLRRHVIQEAAAAGGDDVGRAFRPGLHQPLGALEIGRELEHPLRRLEFAQQHAVRGFLRAFLRQRCGRGCCA